MLRSVGESLVFMRELQIDFETKYVKMLNAVLALDKPVCLCTVYYPRFSSDEKNLEQTAYELTFLVVRPKSCRLLV